MVRNSASRLITALLLPGYEDFVRSLDNTANLAYSPVQDYNILPDGSTLFCSISIEGINIRETVYLFCLGFTTDDTLKLRDYLESAFPGVRLSLSLSLKVSISLKSLFFNPALKNSIPVTLSDPHFRIDVVSLHENSEKQLSILFTVEFIRKFSKKLYYGCAPDLTDSEIFNFFKNPLSLFPRITTILETCSDAEIQGLFFTLYTENLLTIYQLCLLIIALPDKVSLIKRNLSSATISDVKTMMVRFKSVTPLSRRDLAGGIYSVEEAIFHLLRREKGSWYGRLFMSVKPLVEFISALNVFNSRNIADWFTEMDRNNLFYNTLSITPERDIAHAASGDPDVLLPMIKKHVTEKRLHELIQLVGSRHPSIREIIISQAKTVSNYRKLKIQKIHPSPDSFEYLLLSFEKGDDYNRLLLETGWFPLSTACKSLHKKTLNRLLKNLYPPAGFLIEDVIKGTVNPNILHDEIQVRKAQGICVEGILSLYQLGEISLCL